MIHKVRTSKWKEQILVHEENVFHDIKEAIEFARGIVDGYIKIYNEIDELLFSWECGNTQKHESYA